MIQDNEGVEIYKYENLAKLLYSKGGTKEIVESLNNCCKLFARKEGIDAEKLIQSIINGDDIAPTEAEQEYFLLKGLSVSFYEMQVTPFLLLEKEN